MLHSVQIFKPGLGWLGADDLEGIVEKTEGLRERKRRETRDRLAETGLKLFLKHGYEATTLDAIAAAAGISRRAFFYHFKSKEDVLFAWEGHNFVKALRPAILAESPEQPPLQVARNCLTKLAAHYETEESAAVDRLLRSSDALRLRKEGVFVEMEQILAEAMQELWPEPTRRDALRATAMIAMGTLRLAIDWWRRDEAVRRLADYIADGFVLLETQFYGRDMITAGMPAGSGHHA